MYYVPVVSVRLPEGDLDYLKQKGENVSQVVRSALHERIEWMRFEEAQARLKQKSFRPSRPGGRTIREDRDHAH